MQKLTADLSDRVTELNFLYAVSQLITEAGDFEDVIFEEVVQMIPLIWQSPKICARILLDRREFKTTGFQESSLKLVSNLIAFNQKIGEIQLYSLEKDKETPFLDEQRALIDALARELEKFIERKQSEDKQVQKLKELETINIELKSFAYVVSHDLKAPLRSMNSLIAWLIADYSDKLDEKGKEILELLKGKTMQMGNLISDILQYSRVGRVKERKTMVDLNKLVTKVIDQIAPPTNIKIEIESLPSLLCAKTQIFQIFQNLIENAVKFMDKPQGRITVGCVKENGYWKIYVRDNGSGIDAKDFDKIFQLFQTFAPQYNVEGTGIGLALVKKIVEMWGGKIWVESAIGVGSTFFFSLPKKESQNT